MALGKLLDYSAARISGAQMKAAGYVGAIRYLPKPSPSGVVTLTQAEYADLTSHGLHVAVVFEHNDRLRPLQGRTAGVQDAQWAKQVAAQEGIPVPPRSIYMAHDIWEAEYLTGANFQKLRDYQAGAHSVLGASAAVYGFKEIVQAARDDGTAFKFWQCGRESDVLAHVNVYQQNYGQVTVGGVGCDVNKVLTEDYGQHPAPPGVDPLPDPDSGEDLSDMIIFGMARLSKDGPDGRQGDVFKIAYLTNQYAKVPNPHVLAQVVDMHKRKDYKVDTFDTDTMDRFGTEVKWGRLS